MSTEGSTHRATPAELEADIARWREVTRKAKLSLD